MPLLAQFRADQEVWSDTGGTTAATDGGAVAGWGVASGTLSTSIATQSTSARRPTYTANDGGYPSLTFSNANRSSLLLSHTSDWLVSAVSWLAVVRPTKTTVIAGGTGNGILWGKGASWLNIGAHIGQLITGINSPANVFWWHTGYTSRIATFSTADGSATWSVVWGVADGVCIKGGVNRQTAVRTSQSQTIALGTNAVAIGADADNTVYSMAGTMREIAFWDEALSESAMAAQVDAAMSRWGISNSVTPPASGGGLILPRPQNGGYSA